jgi:hypothetical protein
MSNNNIRKSVIASAIVGAFMFGAGVANAGSLAELHAAGQQTVRASAQSQEKINNIYEQSQELVAEYNQYIVQIENRKVYNEHVAKLVADQNAILASLEKQIGGIEATRQGIVPLMYKMVDTLEKFIEADMPIDKAKRLERIARLRSYMSSANVNTAEMYRLVIDAYQVERQYGSALVTYADKLVIDGSEIAVNFVYVGRVAYLAQSLDEKRAWMWNKKTNAWQELGPEYLESTKLAIRVAGKQAAAELLKLPVLAAE